MGSLRGYRPLLAGSSAGIVRRRRLLTPGDGVEAEQDQQHGVGLIPRSVAGVRTCWRELKNRNTHRRTSSSWIIWTSPSQTASVLGDFRFRLLKLYVTNDNKTPTTAPHGVWSPLTAAGTDCVYQQSSESAQPHLTCVARWVTLPSHLRVPGPARRSSAMPVCGLALTPAHTGLSIDRPGIPPRVHARVTSAACDQSQETRVKSSK